MSAIAQTRAAAVAIRVPFRPGLLSPLGSGAGMREL